MSNSTKEQILQTAAATKHDYDDPNFVKFRDAVWSARDEWNIEASEEDQLHISIGNLYSMWFVSKPVHNMTFSEHWRKPKTWKESNYALINISGFAMADAQKGYVVMYAWMRSHFPNLTDAQWEKYVSTMFTPVWQQQESAFLGAAQDRQAKRRAKEEPNKKGIRPQITELLKLHGPLSIGEMVNHLKSSVKSINNACSRMLKAGDLVRVGRGKYALPGSIGPEAPIAQETAIVAPQPQAETPVKTRPKFVRLDAAEIEDRKQPQKKREFKPTMFLPTNQIDFSDLEEERLAALPPSPAVPPGKKFRNDAEFLNEHLRTTRPFSPPVKQT